MTTPNLTNLQLFATSPKGLELLLVDELKALGATTAAEKLAGVAFTGSLETAYKACLWSRLANRILLFLTKVSASTPDELYNGVKTIQWDQHVDPQGTIAVHCVCSQSEITHSLFAAQKVKDAIVDQLRDKYGIRPNVDRARPDLSIYVYLHRNEAAISLDLSGDSLHRRGYRLESSSAPLKENLAAAILLRSGWQAIAKEQGSIYDPMCGSGTLLIEAAMMAGDLAPGLTREYFGFLGWKKHQAAIWQNLLADAKQRYQIGLKNIPAIVGYDHDPHSIKIAFANIERAGLMRHIHVEKRELSDFVPNKTDKTGLIVTNPPYGERLGQLEELQPLYTLLGERFKQAFSGWKAAVFTGNPDLGKQMGLRAKKFYALFNGTIPCKLFLFDIEPPFFIDRSPAAENERRIRIAKRAMEGQEQQGVEMFVNRLRKNLKRMRAISGRDQQQPYRLYDADIPEYAFVIDLLDTCAEVKEYEAPRFVDEAKVSLRRNQVLAVLPEELQLLPGQIKFGVREKKKK